MPAQGSGPYSGGDAPQVHFHVSAMDSQDVRAFFRNNATHVADALHAALRGSGGARFRTL